MSNAPAPAPVPVEQKSVVSDGPFGRAAIAVFRRVLAPHVGWTSPRPGYGGMVEECRMLLAKMTPEQQRQIVLAVLGTLFVAPRGPALFRKYFAGKPDINAKITPAFFSWLVGPSNTNDSPEAGGTLGTGVLIEKCRFLDESGCKGLCLNMCQQVCLFFLLTHPYPNLVTLLKCAQDAKNNSAALRTFLGGATCDSFFPPISSL
jgi:hypothetical protein